MTQQADLQLAAGRPPLLRMLAPLVTRERLNQWGLAVALGVEVAIIASQTPFFLTSGNLINVGRAIAITGIVAAVTTIVLVAGELDLSVGAVMAFAGIVAAEVLTTGHGLGLALVAGLASGLGMGLVNAVLIVGVGVNPLIATIGTQFAFRGIAFIWTGGIPVSTFGHSSFSYLGNGDVVGSFPFSVLLLLVVFLVVGGVLGVTQWGSHVYAIGGSRDAARLAGVPVRRIRVLVYVLSAVASALAGIVLASVNGSASPATGQGVELTIIGAVILGGTALAGGRGTVVGTFLGIVFLGALANGMNLVGLAGYWQIFIQGVVLVVAITIDELWRKRVRA